MRGQILGVLKGNFLGQVGQSQDKLITAIAASNIRFADVAAQQGAQRL